MLPRESLSSRASRYGIFAKMAMEDYPGKVFKTERDIKDLSEQRERSGGILELEEILKLRRAKSAPVLAAFKRWVEDLLPG
jgi:hypothetical protein